MNGRKGQHLTVEQMFLFVMGLLITIGIFFAFRTISGHVSGLVEEDRLEEVATLTLTGVAQVAKELPNNEQTSLVVTIPKEISRQEYIIEAVGSDIVISLPQTSQELRVPLEGIERAYAVTGRVSSSSGRVAIEGFGGARTIRLVRA